MSTGVEFAGVCMREGSLGRFPSSPFSLFLFYLFPIFKNVGLEFHGFLHSYTRHLSIAILKRTSFFSIITENGDIAVVLQDVAFAFSIRFGTFDLLPD